MAVVSLDNEAARRNLPIPTMSQASELNLAKTDTFQNPHETLVKRKSL